MFSPMHPSVCQCLSDCPSQNVSTLVNATPIISDVSDWNFAGVFVKVSLAVSLRWIFVTFFALWTWSLIGSTSTNAYRHWVSCEGNTSYNFSQIFLKFCRWFLDVILRLFLSLLCSLNLILFMSPPLRVGRHIVLPSSSVWLSVTKSCPL